MSASDPTQQSAARGLTTAPVPTGIRPQQDSGHKQKRRYVSGPMSEMTRAADGLHRHDCGVYRARPHGEPDQTETGFGLCAAFGNKAPSVA